MASYFGRRYDNPPPLPAFGPGQGDAEERMIYQAGTRDNEDNDIRIFRKRKRCYFHGEYVLLSESKDSSIKEMLAREDVVCSSSSWTSIQE